MPLLSPTKTMGIFEHVEMSPSASTRPAASNWGTSTTPGNNTFGTAVAIGSNTTEDLWALEFTVTGVAVSAAAKDLLVQIGFDFAGGTTFPASPDRYNSITLLASCAIGYNLGFVKYWFPLCIPAGTKIMARSSVNNATVGSAFVAWAGWGRPKYPEATRRGQYVESLGAVTATSKGTDITPGTTSDGTAVLMGTLAADHPCWYWEFGYGINDSTMANNAIHCDLLAGSDTGDVILRDGYVRTTSGEGIEKLPSIHRWPWADVPGGTGIYARSQVSGTADSANSMMAYGVGG